MTGKETKNRTKAQENGIAEAKQEFQTNAKKKPLNLRIEQAILTMKARFSLLLMVEGFHELSMNEEIKISLNKY